MRKMHRQKKDNLIYYILTLKVDLFHRVFECLEEYCASIDETRSKEVLNVCRVDVSCKFTTQKVGGDNKNSLQVIISRGSMASHQPLLSRRQCSLAAIQCSAWFIFRHRLRKLLRDHMDRCFLCHDAILLFSSEQNVQQ